MKKKSKAKKIRGGEGEKEYIITYRSVEHYEVVGWVRARTIKEAKKKAQRELINDARRYDVKEAKIAEWRDPEGISFEL